MDNVTVIKNDEGVEHVIIDRGNGEYTSMSKEHWDKLQAERERSETL